MRKHISRWFLFGLLLGWSLTHATVFGQPVGKTAANTGKVGAGVDKLRQGLDKAITVDFTGQSLEEVLNHIKDRSGLPISIDDASIAMMGMNFVRPDGQPMQFQVKATNEKASTVLRKFLNNYRLCYVIFEDSLLITAEEMALLRQMRQRVSVNLEDVPAKKAITDLARNHGINLVIDPKVVKQAETPVSLQVDNTGIETAVRLLAELASLKAVRMGNVMFVTSEDKAKKIRDEEQHQFDNPLNPNVPGGPPIGIGFGGGFGGGGGVMPFQGRVAPGGIAVPGIDLPVPAPKPDPAPPGKDGTESSPPQKKVVVPVPPLPPDVPRPSSVDRPPLPPVPVPRRDPAER